jgi:hypothetical protein
MLTHPGLQYVGNVIDYVGQVAHPIIFCFIFLNFFFLAFLACPMECNAVFHWGGFA